MKSGIGSQIPGVVFRPINPDLLNSRPKRDMIGVCNGENDLDGFVAKQIKNMIIHEDEILGGDGHYHDYAELYAVVNKGGEVIFDLLDRNTGIHERITVPHLHMLLIPGGVVHRAYGKAGTWISAGTSDFFVFPGTDKTHPLPPIGGLPYNLK